MIIQNYIAIFIFLIICTFFGITLNHFFRFTKYFEENLYKLLSLITIGFGIFFISIFIIGVLRIPLVIWLFLVLSSVIPIYLLIKNYKKININNLKLKLDKSHFYQVALILVLFIFFFIMLKGTFSYNWLEDDDPWAYARGAKYVSIYHNYHLPVEVTSGYYLFPGSPPGLSTLFGLIHQTTPDLFFTMKFFINLFLLIGVIAFFLFAYNFSEKNHLFAIIATFILIIVPCFAGHFIFNYTLSISIFLIFLLSLSFAFIEFKNLILSGILCGSVIIAHGIIAIQTAVILFILIIIYLIKDKKLFKNFKIKSFIKESIAFRIVLIGLLGLTFSFLLYADIFISSGVNNMIGMGSVLTLNYNYQKASYDIEDKHLNDFFIAKNVSRMDQEEGVGIFLFSICILGLLLFYFIKDKIESKNIVYLILFLWYFIFLWILTGGYFHFAAQNYRWWSVFAIFIALHAAATIIILIKMLKKYLFILFPLLLILLIGLIMTSAMPRYTVQTSQWPPGVSFNSYEQVKGYGSLKQLGFNKKIFGICDSAHIIAYNQIDYPWDEDIVDYFDYLRNKSIIKKQDELISNIDKINNKYNMDMMIIDSNCINYLDINMTNSLLQYYLTNSNYVIDQKLSNQAFFLFIKKNN